MRRAMLTLLILLVALSAAGCGGTGSTKVESFAGSGKLKVATSFYPLYEFAKAVGGEKVDIVNLVPAGTEPHDWEPTPGHIKVLNESALFFYNGAGFEHWVEKSLTALDNKNLVSVETSTGFDLIHVEEEHADGAKDEQKDDHDHEGGIDPHLWLDPQGVIHTVTVIRDSLIKADAVNKATYEANAAAYIEQLKALDAEMKSGLSQCRTQEFFTTHDAFGYLARRYSLTQHPIMGLAPDAEPTAKDLQAVVEEAKAEQIKYIFFETLVSDKVANVVAQEVGAKTLVLNPFEGLTDDEVKAGKSYLSVMRENLANLKTALECK